MLLLGLLKKIIKIVINRETHFYIIVYTFMKTIYFFYLVIC